MAVSRACVEANSKRQLLLVVQPRLGEVQAVRVYRVCPACNPVLRSLDCWCWAASTTCVAPLRRAAVAEELAALRAELKEVSITAAVLRQVPVLHLDLPGLA
ncbi:unnamed protein product [Arctogadus glacialis]